ncbi:DUF559 domain-containing protein [Pengzhenrongella sicca]|uniref:DUF559 domain-containing protein n=1 Tax=Pengzhenrongella sicca TaxID=2819238 RepID=A0A8A4Z8K7_9MICO|nr:DUF559 domain-containing protein [Pengzhenrongella sicca]QTE27805.1 DUF559 domain-containing protein [Pengzhenrongella sicca]
MTDRAPAHHPADRDPAGLRPAARLPAARYPAGWAPAVAVRQAGLFTGAQAVAAGMTVAQVRRRRQTGRWVTVVGAALAPAGLELTPWHLAHGAWLSWPDAVVCLGTAARVHRLPVPDDGRVHVLVPSPRAARGALSPHQFAVRPADVSRAGRAPITTFARTLFDCIGRLDDRTSEHLVIWALTRELYSREELELALAQRPRRWGNTRRRRALADTRTGAMGPAERRLHAILTNAGITGWLADVPVVDADGTIGRADVLFPAVGLVIEVDGVAYHGADQFQGDRTRQNRLVNAGLTVLRFTWQDLTEGPTEVVRQITTALHRLADTLS